MLFTPLYGVGIFNVPKLKSFKMSPKYNKRPQNCTKLHWCCVVSLIKSLRHIYTQLKYVFVCLFPENQEDDVKNLFVDIAWKRGYPDKAEYCTTNTAEGLGKTHSQSRATTAIDTLYIVNVCAGTLAQDFPISASPPFSMVSVQYQCTVMDRKHTWGRRTSFPLSLKNNAGS